MQSRFHQTALALLDRGAALSPAALARVEARERLLGFGLPAAVREWYALDEAPAAFGPYAIDDVPIPLETLGDELARPRGFGCDLLLLMHAREGACLWGAPLDGSDDPPVLVQVDDRRWQVHIAGFAAFARVRVWDGLVARESRLAARDRSLGAADLARLRQRFTEMPRTKGWPTQVQYRFERRDQRLLIVDDEVGQSAWLLAADDGDSLRELAREVAPLGTLARTLYALPRAAADAGRSAERVLRELREETG